MAGILANDTRRGRARNPAPDAIIAIVLVFALGPVWVWHLDFRKPHQPFTTAPADSVSASPSLLDRPGEPLSKALTDPLQPPAIDWIGPTPLQAIQAVDRDAESQRVVLYEEDPADPQGRRYVGAAIWRSEMVTPRAGALPELVVRADLDVPERGIAMVFLFRRNTDKALPASHTIELTFKLSTDFTSGGIQNVPGILMKQSEQTRGAPFTGLAVKVTSGFFLVGLSAVEADKRRNLELLKERSWFDIPIVYNNGRRAILAIEKGTPGERAFDEAFEFWGR